MPKIVRRQALDWVRNLNTRRHAFLSTARTRNGCYKTCEFLEQGPTVAK